MSHNITVFCKNTNSDLKIEEGKDLLQVFQDHQIQLPHQVLCARVNNKTEDLSYRIYNPKTIEFLDTSHPSGMRVYVRSLCFVLYKAVKECLPEARLRIELSVSRGYFCTLNHRQEISEEAILKIKGRMQEIIKADIPFERIECPTSEAIPLFREHNMRDKVSLLETSNSYYTIYYKLHNLIDSYYSCLTPSTGYLNAFDLIKYDGGMLLIPPSRNNPESAEVVVEQPKMLNAFKEYLHFNQIAGLSNVGSLNIAIKKNRAPVLIKVTEALHEKKIIRIADEIAARHNGGTGGKIILISGPSSSGKTTFSKRLEIQLMTNLLLPVTISLDNYFVERNKTPLDESGDYDYESLYALDLDLFNSDLNRLLQGEEVALPSYNFETGKRVYKGNKLRLNDTSVLLMEGIHALNPALTTQIPEHLKYKIYVSALTTISIDDHNWIPTTDNRLLRRIIRDYKYRGYTAQMTIARWESVRRGEDKWIFPFQENADALFNSALLFELAVLKRHAEPILQEVPRNCPEYGEANRLLKFLSYFLSINEHEIPPTSLLREFLGGSSFRY